MLTKSDILQYIKAIAEKQLITKEELIAAYNEGSNTLIHHIPAKKLALTEILYFIGAGIVFLGIAILLAQNWQTLRIDTKILSTFGSGIAAYIVGFLFSREKKTETIGSAFFLIFSLATPIGLYVILDHAGYRTNSFGVQSIISGIIFGAQLFSFFVFRKNIFMLFSILFGTWFFLSLSNFLIAGHLYLSTSKFYGYRILAAGLAYLLLGYAFSDSKQASLSGFLYSFGILGFLGAALCLGDWKPNQNIFWEIAFPFLAFGAIFLSTYLKNKIFLIFGTLFLLAYILKITSEYFTQSLGWPFALVVAGLVMIAISYMSLRLRKKYL